MFRSFNSIAVATLALTVLCGLYTGPVAAQTISATPVANMPSVAGSVSAIVEYNGLIIVGGSFTQVGGQTRSGLAAIDAATGAVTNWNPAITGNIFSMALAGDTLYVGGPITAINGQARTELASFYLPNMSQSGGGLTTWAPVVSNNIQCFFFGDGVGCLAVMNNKLYVGGFFAQVNGSDRGGLASFDLSSLSVNSGLTSWDPNTTTTSQIGSGFEIWGAFNIFAHSASNSVIVTGPFEGVGGLHMATGTSSGHTAVARSGLASLDATTGNCKSWDPDCGSTTWNDEAMGGRGNILYLGGVGYTIHGGGTSVQRSYFCGMDCTVDTAVANPATGFNPNPDERAWAIGVNPAGNLVIAAGQWTNVGGVAHGKLLAFSAASGALISGWDPAPSSYPRSIYVNAARVYVGGGFTTIAGQSRSGFAAFDITSGAPELDTFRGTTAVADGSTDNVGSAFTAGGASTLTYTFSNTGTAALTLSGPATLGSLTNCSVSITSAPASNVAAASSTTTTLSVTPTAAGAFSFTYSIGNNDSNENPYNWTISGSASAAPAAEIDVQRGTTAIADGGTDNVSGGVAGTPISLSYTIRNLGNAALTLTTPVAAPGSLSNCSASITTQPASSVSASASTTLTISVTPGASGAFSCTLSISNNDSNENPYNWTINGSASAAPAPELDVLRGSTAIADGGADNVGSSFTAGAASTLTYTFANTGSATLTLSGPATIGSLSNCSVSVTSAPAASVGAGSSASTILSVTPTAMGAFSFTYSLVNNDSNENPYNFTVTGNAAAAPAPEMDVLRGSSPVADGGTDTVGNVANGVAQSVAYTIKNTGSAGLILTGAPALVAVSAGSNVSLVSVTQQPGSSVAAAGSTTFSVNYTVTGAGAFSFTISIDNNDSDESPYNWTVFGAGIAGPEIDVARGAASVADGGTDLIASAQPAVALNLSYTIRNLGGQDLMLTTPVTIGNAVNCSVNVVQQPNATVAAPGSTTLLLEVTPVAAGAFGFSVSVANNDSDENPYDWSVQGTAAATPSGNGSGLGGASGGGCSTDENTRTLWMLAALPLLLLGARRLRRHSR